LHDKNIIVINSKDKYWVNLGFSLINENNIIQCNQSFMNVVQCLKVENLDAMFTKLNQNTYFINFKEASKSCKIIVILIVFVRHKQNNR